MPMRMSMPCTFDANIDTPVYTLVCTDSRTDACAHVHMDVRTHVCKWASMSVRMPAHTSARIHASHVCVHVRAHSCTQVYSHVYMPVHTSHTLMHAHRRTRVNTCRHKCVHICVHALLHTRARTFPHTCPHTCLHTRLHTCLTCKGAAVRPRNGDVGSVLLATELGDAGTVYAHAYRHARVWTRVQVCVGMCAEMIPTSCRPTWETQEHGHTRRRVCRRACATCA